MEPVGGHTQPWGGVLPEKMSSKKATFDFIQPTLVLRMMILYWRKM